MSNPSDTRSLGLCYFRNLVGRCYREARYLGTAGSYGPLEKFYPVCKIKLNYPDGQNGRTWVKPVFDLVRSEEDVEAIEKTFARRLNGLTLEQLGEAFALGQWKPNIGGKKWATIVEGTIGLRRAIELNDEENLQSTIASIDGLWHNTRKVVEDFIEPCR